MVDYEQLAEKVIRTSDIVLLVVDARMARQSINKLFEARIKKYGKKIIYVINKCDLLDKQDLSRIQMADSVKVSSLKRMGTLKLLKRIQELARGKDVVVGVVGFPNTGKSSVINALKGRKSAPTSPVSGYTKGMQKLRISSNIMMIDTPGVLPYSKKRPDLIMIGAIDADKLRDPENAAADLIDSLNGRVEKHFGVRKTKDKIKTIENIAIKKSILKKGGEPDTARMSREILRLCQRGKIKIS
ncbi:GTPase [Thermoproteota archaeon]